MRASSLSSHKVIDLLNGYFVPVYVSNEELRGPRSAEGAVVNRIYRTALEKKLSAGTVCIYLVAPDGEPVATAPLNKKVAADPERLAELMERVVGDLKVTKGEPLVAAKPQSSPRHADADAVVLHVVARYLERRKDELVPHDATSVLGTKRGGNWGNLPSEGWVVLDKAESLKLLPQGNVAAGSEWNPDSAVIAKLLNHFYPPTENTNLKKNRIDEQSLKARVESVENGVARARLEGKLRMKHPFDHKDDENVVEANLIGYLEFAADKSSVRSFRLVTDGGRYGDEKHAQPFGAAARSEKRSKD